jgi:hypothetical protein
MHFGSTPTDRPADAVRTPRFGRGLRTVAAVALLLAATGCEDAPTDPLAQLVTGETAASLQVPVALPGLAELAARAGVEAELAPALGQWQSSWTDPVLGEAERDAAVHTAVPLLAEALGEGGVVSVLTPLHQVERDLAHLDDVPVDLLPRVEAVRSLVRESRTALREGREERALSAGLLASDRLRSLGPVAVARTLVARADRALMATVGVDDAHALSVARGERMLHGARAALAEGDAERAVQRAFYAVQLLEQALSPTRR